MVDINQSLETVKEVGNPHNEFTTSLKKEHEQRKHGDHEFLICEDISDVESSDEEASYIESEF